MNKKYFFSHRVLAMLLTLTLCLGMIPTASAAQQNSYHDPVEHWQQASNRTNELDVNAIVTHETFYCATCRENTDFTVWRVPEYTRSGETALNRNVKYSNGMCIDEVTVGSLDAGVPGENAYYTGYHWTKSVCSRCGDWNSNETNGAPYAWDKNIYVLHDCAAKFYLDLPETVTHEYVDSKYHRTVTKGGTYCCFCYGTNYEKSSVLERHDMAAETLPQPAHGRFAAVEKCRLCDYTCYDYTAAKAVVASYYGVADGQPHTISVTDLSEAGVRTAIRYGNSADSCTMTSAPNYTDEGQYGKSKTIFAPDDAITRAEFTTLAVRFFDVYGDGDAEIMEQYMLKRMTGMQRASSQFWIRRYVTIAVPIIQEAVCQFSKRS